MKVCVPAFFLNFTFLSFLFLRCLPFPLLVVLLAWLQRATGAPAAPAIPKTAKSTAAVASLPKMVIEEIHITSDNSELFAAFRDVVIAKDIAEMHKAAEILRSLATPPVTTATATAVSAATVKLTKEESREKFQSHKNRKNATVSDTFKSECVATVKRYLNDCEAARGKTAKAVIATCLMEYFIQIPAFLANHERFSNAVITKMEEFKEEDAIPDAVISKRFQEAVDAVLFVVKA